jgi:hypothetical protein
MTPGLPIRQYGYWTFLAMPVTSPRLAALVRPLLLSLPR